MSCNGRGGVDVEYLVDSETVGRAGNALPDQPTVRNGGAPRPLGYLLMRLIAGTAFLEARQLRSYSRAPPSVRNT